MPTENAIRHEDLIVDEETGEVLQWPEGVGANRFEYLMEQHAEAGAMESAWKGRRQYLSRAMERDLGEMNVRNYAGERTKAVAFAGRTNRSATVERAKEALEFKIINQEEFDALLEHCADRLSPDAINEMVKAGTLREDQAKYLIQTSVSAGYVRTMPVLKDEPKAAAKKRSEFEAVQA